MLPKGLIKEQKWLLVREDWNVDTGIGTGLVGRGQIGKGMWAMPDAMSDMMESKVAHPRGWGQHGLGAFANGSRAPCDALSRGFRSRPPARVGSEVAGGFRGYPHALLGGGRVDGRRDRKESWTTMPREFWKTSCWVGQGIGVQRSSI